MKRFFLACLLGSALLLWRQLEAEQESASPKAAPPQTAATVAVRPHSTDLTELRARFDSDHDAVRLLLVLSPT